MTRSRTSVQGLVGNEADVGEEMAYFISSKKENAFLYREETRSHWAIENTLRWVKDVTLKEDASIIKMENAPQNISTYFKQYDILNLCNFSMKCLKKGYRIKKGFIFVNKKEHCVYNL